MSNRPLILITNDDGVHAPGIKHLWNALQGMGDLIVVAPAHEQSAVGLSITIRHPLHLEQQKWKSGDVETKVWSVNGTPADCMKLALSVLVPRPPDLIVSGINRGTNSGRNVLYSGTVAAVIEGVMHDVPGIAFSIADYFNPIYDEVESLVVPIVKYTLEHNLPNGTFLNVNFPPVMGSHFKGFRFARQGREFWIEDPEKRLHPVVGSDYYWLGAKIAQFEEEEDSDIACLREGYATAVPIHVSDLTHHLHLEKHRELFENFVNANLFLESTN